jgi:hypothetical protein
MICWRLMFLIEIVCRSKKDSKQETYCTYKTKAIGKKNRVELIRMLRIACAVTNALPKSGVV